MPHLTLEYSRNLEADGDPGGLVATLARVLVDQRADGQPVFPIGGVRVRAIAVDHWCIADGSVADAGFVHASLKVGAGRAPVVLRAAGDAVFEAIKAHFARHHERQGMALSLEIGEFAEAGTWKHNNLHARFAAR